MGMAMMSKRRDTSSFPFGGSLCIALPPTTRAVPSGSWMDGFPATKEPTIFFQITDANKKIFSVPQSSAKMEVPLGKTTDFMMLLLAVKMELIVHRQNQSSLPILGPPS
ncbi:uncharacterized protein LOC144615729 [Panthera onca]